MDRLRELEPQAEDAGFREEFLRIKQENKEHLAQIIRETTLVEVDPQSMFAVQVKRVHEYKRQLMNVLQVIHQYLRIVEEAEMLPAPQTFIFAGKAARAHPHIHGRRGRLCGLRCLLRWLRLFLLGRQVIRSGEDSMRCILTS